MPDFYQKFTGKIDRRSPHNEGDFSSPLIRDNWLARDGRLTKPKGHEAVITDLSDVPRWEARYSTIEAGVISPKSFVYTQDGNISVLNDQAGTSSVTKTLVNENARPRHWLFKTANQTTMFWVDGANLYKYDGNNDNNFENVNLLDSEGNSVKPIDLIEHKDRLFVISNTDLFVSKNLEPEVFDDATDSLQIIVGSGKGRNLAVGKIEDKLYIFNTEGIFVLNGDVISALASTFEVRLVDERSIIAGGTLFKVEKALLFMADDHELWSWDGSNAQMLSFEYKLKDFVNTSQEMLNKATAIYHNNYYKMSFVENGTVEPNMEIWWDAFEDKIDIVRGRQVSCYMKTDPTIETEYTQMGRSDTGKIVQDDRGFDFDGAAIATRLRTRDLTVKKGFNVRFLAFYLEMIPTGNRDLIIRYLLDGRSSNPDGANAHFSQHLQGETLTLGFIEIDNQGQFSGRARPKINYARGESIAFEVIDSTLGLQADWIGVGIDYIVKQKSKGITIGA